MLNLRTHLGLAALTLATVAVPTSDAAKAPETLRVQPQHAWRPPFGLDRVGAPTHVVVEGDALGRLSLAQLRGGREVSRSVIDRPANAPSSSVVPVDAATTEVILYSEASVELARLAIDRPSLEADGVARVDAIVNPVDLGTILPPSDWLLLGPGRSAIVDFAAFAREDRDGARFAAWFESEPARRVEAPASLSGGQRTTARLVLPAPGGEADRDALRVALLDRDGEPLWEKSIPTMLVREVADRPAFGAYETKLRYDAPISVRDPATGAFSSLDYAKGWRPELNDVVVRLPNGGRFVFWRGSSYIPFWAGRHNTGACYEWAEVMSRQPDAVDCVEPLMDKELRYGKVEIVESTAARVHVRWTYQSTDLHYKVWGDQAVEDYYFYPDGFGTRVVSLKTDPATEYELCELIVLTPQSTFPLDVLPENLVDALALDGAKREYRSPIRTEADRPTAGESPAVYRLRLNRREEAAAICFNPGDKAFPPVVFGPFFDQGVQVTPWYWGSHWPLARGNATGSTIDERVSASPCHNSVMSWAGTRPAPIAESTRLTLDAAGKSRVMASRRWAWLIGMSDADDARLIEWARSYARPPSLTTKGATVAFDGWSAERRAFVLEATARTIEIAAAAEVPCVNPVFEIQGAPAAPPRVAVDGRELAEGSFAWDGRTLWLDATISGLSTIRVEFPAP